MARIAVGGWQHETNTFATIKADFQAFEEADEWPPLCSGQDMFDKTLSVHLPISGAVEVLRNRGHELVPIQWCSATPCSYVTEHAFEEISNRFITLLKEALPVDGIYLDLHGAMVCEHLEDGEGEFLRRLRLEVGPDLPIVVSLDLHANVTPLMVAHATVLDIFRTYPHIDMGETGGRAAETLHWILQHNTQLYSSFRQTDFIIALNWGCSLIEPCQSIYQKLPEFIKQEVESASFACGFHLSDIHDVGPSIVTYATSQTAADNAADQLVALVHQNESVFYQKIWPATEGVMQAQKLLASGAKTIVLADTQDNPGGGGSGDTTGVLQALLEANVKNAVFGVLSDPVAVEHAVTAGVGNTVSLSLGGKSGLPGQKPFECIGKVLKLTDGKFTATGPMYKGAQMTLGNCALLEIGNVKVMLSSRPVQTADQSVFRHVGIEPAEMPIVALKSSVHFRNDFTDLANEILLLSAPGAVFADPSMLHYKNKRTEIRILQ